MDIKERLRRINANSFYGAGRIDRDHMIKEVEEILRRKKMGIDLHYGFYTKKCVDKEILPYLDVEPNELWDWGECWFNGKYMPEGFYDACRELSTDDKENNCYIFDDCEKLFKFAARTEVPDTLNNFITKYYTDEVPIFIIWVR